VEEEASGNEDELENSNADLGNEGVDDSISGNTQGQPLVPRSVPQETERVHQKYGKVSVFLKILKCIIIYLDFLNVLEKEVRCI
jgi:hypothetical protein